jgi:hypothetical protein
MLEAVPLSAEDLEFKSPIEWEEAQEGFFLGRFFRTVQRALFAPLTFYENLRRGGSYGKPLVYAFLVEFLTNAISSLLWGGLFAGFIFGGSGHFGVLAANFKIFHLFVWIILFFANLLGASWVYYMAAGLMGARGSYRTLFRMYAYSNTAVLYRLIPFVGSMIAELYRVALLFCGFKAVYRFSTVRALVSAIAPAVAILILIKLSGFSLYDYLMKV